MENKIIVRPTYWASVSGGKDSLYMLKFILCNLDVYPLDGVVHYELEIDYPWIKNVVDYMEKECIKYGIKFVRIKPRVSWFELYDKYGYPTRLSRWCNSAYKLDAARQIDAILKDQGLQCVHYVGYCVDEKKRYSKRKENGITEIYPLVDYDINESVILEWARKQPIFNNYYKFFRRCGCMFCPMLTMLEYAYIYKYYPDKFAYIIKAMNATERALSEKYGRKFSVISANAKYDSEYLYHIVRGKWLPILEKMERESDDRQKMPLY